MEPFMVSKLKVFLQNRKDITIEEDK